MSDPIASAREEGRSALTEAESKALLREAGLSVPQFAAAETADAAAAAADDLGYPVVVKVSAAAVQHKSEWAGGAGVALGLKDAAAVREAADRILTAADERGIEADVLVEEAANLDAGTELIVGGLRSPSFGPTVLVGLGGVFAELYEDANHRLAPLSTDEARRAIRGLRAARLLTGFRDRPAADLDALAATVKAVGDLLVERDEIAEIDANPVLATADGTAVLDALVVLDEE